MMWVGWWLNIYFLHCFRVYFASWKCFYLSPSLSRFPGSLRARRKKLRQEKKVWGRRKKYQAGEKGFFFLLVGHSGFRLTRLNDQIALWSSGDLLFLKLPFAVRPGLTGSRVSKDAKQFRLNLWVPGWLDGLNSQVSWGLGWPGLLNGTKCSSWNCPLPLGLVSPVQELAKMQSSSGLIFGCQGGWMVWIARLAGVWGGQVC